MKSHSVNMRTTKLYMKISSQCIYFYRKFRFNADKTYEQNEPSLESGEENG